MKIQKQMHEDMDKGKSFDIFFKNLRRKLEKAV